MDPLQSLIGIKLTHLLAGVADQTNGVVAPIAAVEG